MEIPEPVRLLALYPFHELPVPPSITVLDGPRVRLGISRQPGAQIVLPNGLEPDEVGAAVEWVRATASEHGKETLAWWIGARDDALAEPLQELGIANADTPGFEAIENGLALLEAPAGDPVDGVEVRMVESRADYRAGTDVLVESFGTPRQSEEQLRESYDDYLADDTGRAFLAIVDGAPAGAAFAAFADAGLNLFGGSVLPAFRGRGVYRALLQARWQLAVERGSPALTVQAGRMSRPICERVGFRFLGASRVFVDELR